MSLRDRSRGNTAVIDEPRGDEPVNSELADLVREIESSADVRLALDGAPEVPSLGARAARATRPAPQRETIPAAATTGHSESQPARPQVVYRDKDDVRTIINQTWVMMLLVVLLVASGTGNVFQYLRRPDRIVVDGPSGRVLSINDKNYGREEGVEFGPDRLTAQDKLYITREYVKALYQIDPATRNRDVERALTMMVPDSAKRLAKWMREKGIVDQQKNESWQTIWIPMEVTVDDNDPYTMNVIGKQDITRVVNGAPLRESKQLRITIKLVADNKGRADRNLRSGFLVSYVDMRELNAPAAAQGSGPDGAAPSSGTQGASQTTPVTALQDQ